MKAIVTNEKLPTDTTAVPAEKALTDPAIPKIYANGFSLGLTNADTQLVLMLFGKPIAVLSLSYTLAKTMADRLSGLVKTWEEKTGNTLQTTDSIDKVFSLESKEGAK